MTKMESERAETQKNLESMAQVLKSVLIEKGADPASLGKLLDGPGELLSQPKSTFDKIVTIVQCIPKKRQETNSTGRLSWRDLEKTPANGIKNKQEELEDEVTDLKDENDYLRLILTRLQVTH